MYESGSRMPKYETLEAIADYFNVNLDFLVGKSNIRNYSNENLSHIPDIFPIEKRKFPLLGSVACGTPVLADENFKGYIEAGNDYKSRFLPSCQRG